MFSESNASWANGGLSYEESLFLAEAETMQKVSATVYALESAIESWERAERKPPSLTKTMSAFRTFLKQLQEWQKASAAIQSKKVVDIKKYEEHLKRFVQICNDYERCVMEKRVK
jgi:hypothetical protein